MRGIDRVLLLTGGRRWLLLKDMDGGSRCRLVCHSVALTTVFASVRFASVGSLLSSPHLGL